MNDKGGVFEVGQTIETPVIHNPVEGGGGGNGGGDSDYHKNNDINSNNNHNNKEQVLEEEGGKEHKSDNSNLPVVVVDVEKREPKEQNGGTAEAGGLRAIGAEYKEGGLRDFEQSENWEQAPAVVAGEDGHSQDGNDYNDHSTREGNREGGVVEGEPKGGGGTGEVRLSV